MGQRTSYPPGTFSYAELETSDADAAQAFYTSVFGWSYQAVPMGDDMPPYHLAMRDGAQVAALFDSERPPHWNCYVTVESVDGSAARAAELGGSVVAEPFDVMTLGRMAVVADPAGAMVSLWEPREHIGSALVNQPGALTWNDLVLPDADAVTGFYGDLFGWTIAEMPDAGGYRTIANGDRSNGGIFPIPDVVPAWIPYFGHEDVDRLVGEVEGLGGRVHDGPRDVPAGRIAVLADPQAAVFAVWTGDYED